MEWTIPLFPCTSIDETLEFYQTLGFEVTHKQRTPYPYGAVRLGEVELHFSRLTVYSPRNPFGSCLVLVSGVAAYHRAFADALRAKYSSVPTSGWPRITRLRRDQARFKLFDPSGNIIIYIDREEPEIDYNASYEKQSDLAQALENAAFLRDTYANDPAAAKVLDTALARPGPFDPVEHARALASRAELAVAMGETENARSLRVELEQIPLSAEDREQFREELQAADVLEAWLRRKTDPV